MSEAMEGKESGAAAPILVLGGTGKTGRRVAQLLERRGHPVRIGSRQAEPAFDWDDPATWDQALEGASAAYITFYPDLAVPGALEAVGGFVDKALKNGVRRLVLLSGRGEEEAQRAEQYLQESGADWTIVRASFFHQNFSESFMLDALKSGLLALPVGEVKEPFVDADDIAEVAVAALTDPSHVGQLYEVTGPRLLSFSEAVAEVAEASGRPIQFQSVPMEDYVGAMKADGVPEAFVSLLTYLFSTVMDGRNTSLSDGIERALGRPPRDFSDYARETAASGVWSADAAADGVAA